MLLGVYRRLRRDRRLLKRSFKAKVKRSLKRYTSELWPAKFLVLLLVKYCLDGSFGHGIFRWTNLDVKWNIDTLPCKVTYVKGPCRRALWPKFLLLFLRDRINFQKSASFIKQLPAVL